MGALNIMCFSVYLSGSLEGIARVRPIRSKETKIFFWGANITRRITPTCFGLAESTPTIPSVPVYLVREPLEHYNEGFHSI